MMPSGPTMTQQGLFNINADSKHPSRSKSVLSHGSVFSPECSSDMRKRSPRPSGRKEKEVSSPRENITWWGVATLIFLAMVSSASGNKLASLAGTLKTFQRHACQGSSLPLQCPQNTTIDILHANYGGALPPLCPSKVGEADLPNSEGGRCQYETTVNYYKMVTKVVDLCHRKRSCDIPVPSPDEFLERDPCPKVNKYIEVAFKCRPDIFINKILCENQRLTLNCGPQSRIAIYNAIFGRTKEGSELCPQRDGFPEDDCQANLVTETVMKECHGATKCEIYASPSVFGRPCPPEYPMYMKTVYTCVPNWILRPSLTHRHDSDAKEPSTQGGEAFENHSDDNKVAEEATSERKDSPANAHGTVRPTLVNTVHDRANLSDRPRLSTNDLINCTVTILSGSPRKEVGIITEWMRAAAFINKNFEKFLLYIVVGLSASILLCLFAVSVRLLIERRKLRHQAKNINHFVEDIEDVDADIDMLTPTGSSSEGGYSPCPPPDPLRENVVRYNTTSRQGVRYNDVDLIPPRSLSTENNQYFYS